MARIWPEKSQQINFGERYYPFIKINKNPTAKIFVVKEANNRKNTGNNKPEHMIAAAKIALVDARINYINRKADY
jgi:hypothetical protein